jgi:glutamate N-acetyltransferase / amino-acid N-acetyltransferase
MAVEQGPLAIDGFRFSAVAAGIKNPQVQRLDLALIMADQPAPAAGVFTTNLVKAAPVQICVRRMAGGLCRAIVMNSGNANACTGEQGIRDTLDLTTALAHTLAIDPEQVFPMSTGVIGNPLPADRIRARFPELKAGLAYDRAADVARAIMTTDTKPKTVFLTGEHSRGTFHMLGIAKGSGMIAPDVATMLAVVLTDVKVHGPFLQECLATACRNSFNCITVDGDTSTNDSVILMAGGHAEALHLSDSARDREVFASVLHQACASLARQMVLDGEGATKLVEVTVRGARDREAALKAARTVAESPLVKTAFNGCDPNWGRIMAAAGRAGVALDPDVVDLYIGEVPVLKNGTLASESWEPAAAEVMKAREFSIILDLKAGNESVTFLTTDFSKEYVAINADYRS